MTTQGLTRSFRILLGVFGVLVGFSIHRLVTFKVEENSIAPSMPQAGQTLVLESFNLESPTYRSDEIRLPESELFSAMLVSRWSRGISVAAFTPDGRSYLADGTVLDLRELFLGLEMVNEVLVDGEGIVWIYTGKNWSLAFAYAGILFACCGALMGAAMRFLKKRVVSVPVPTPVGL